MKNKSSVYMLPALLLFTVACSSQTSFIQAGQSKNTEYTQVVEVQQGKLRGVYNEDRTVQIFAGIPFAAPPVGDLRWREPQDAASWDGVFDADHFGPMAMQERNSALYTFVVNNFFYHKSDITDNAPISEDCLYLNVWAPEGALESQEKLPVLVYIHGGSLQGGSSYYEAYQGENMAKRGIIMVTVAYRLNIFGYFAHEDLALESPNGSTGNYGLLDQIKALEWVHNNIASFGGDADNITIAGESAGSSSVNAVCASPLAKGLFRRAIAESSGLTVPVPPHTFRSYEKSLEAGHAVMEKAGAKSIEELRAMSAKDLLKYKDGYNSMTVDGYALPKTVYEIYMAGENNEEALLNGYNGNESGSFSMFTKMDVNKYKEVLKQTFGDDWETIWQMYPAKNNKEAKAAYNTMFSIVNFSNQHNAWTSIVSQQGKPVYEYIFTRKNGNLDDMHSGEMIYAYSNVPKNKRYNDDDRKLEDIMASYWVNFAKTGNPNGEGLPYWPTAQEEEGKVLNLDAQIKVIDDPYNEVYKYLQPQKM